MVTEVFVMCDGANDSQGKLNILGAFDTIVAGEFPFIHPHCTMAIRLRFDRMDSQESTIHLTIQTESGTKVLAAIDTVLKRGASSTPTGTANMIVNINSIRFETPGDYTITLQVDGIPTAITPLYIRAAQNGNLQ